MSGLRYAHPGYPATGSTPSQGMDQFKVRFSVGMGPASGDARACTPIRFVDLLTDLRQFADMAKGLPDVVTRCRLGRIPGNLVNSAKQSACVR